MEAQEFRIGNWFDPYYSDYRQINMKDLILLENIDRDVFQIPYKNIPLTEDWWDKFGYECVQEFATELKEKSKIPLGLNLIPLVTHIESLPIHKIQNLWYELTGEELTIKETA